MTYEQNCLAHFGIKGQRWGIRRFQNEDRTLTEAGKKRYAKYIEKKHRRDSEFRAEILREKQQGKELPKRRKQLIEKYLDKGYTQEQAEIQALKRYRTERIIKIAGAVTVTAALAYGTYKAHEYIDRYSDKVIAKGTDIHRVTLTPNDDLGKDRPLFVTPDKEDAVKYRGIFGKQLNDYANQNRDPLGSIQGQGVFAITGKLNKDAKIAGEGAGKQIFENLMKNDSEFAKGFRSIKTKTEGAFMSKGTSDYDLFNQNLVGHDEEHNRLNEKFYNALKEKGYDGVIDVNDRRYSGYNAKRPTIMFALKDKLGDQKVNSLPFAQIQRERVEAHNLLYNQNIRKTALKTVIGYLASASGYGSLITGLGIAATVFNEVSSARNAVRYRTLVQQYRREHPNSKLSDKQIIKNEIRNSK